MASLVCREVTKTYGAKGQQTHALQGINLTFPTSGFVVIHGPSGSGKSTLLNLLCGMDRPTSGTLLMDGKGLETFSFKKLCMFRATTIGRLFQHYELFEDLDVLTNAALPLMIRGESPLVAHKRAHELLNLYRLDDLSNHNARSLSGGEKQRLAFIRAILHAPPILLADEPTGALDAENGQQVLAMLHDYSQTHLVIVVTHDLKLFSDPTYSYIGLCDGKVASLTMAEAPSPENGTSQQLSKNPKPSTWPSLFAKSHFQGRKKIHFFGILASAIAWACSLVTLGFALGSSQAIDQASQRYMDYGTASISKVTRTPVEDRPLTLVKSLRPTLSEMAQIAHRFQTMRFEVDVSPLFSNLKGFLGQQELSPFSFCPLRDFSFSTSQRAMVFEGHLPPVDSFDQVILNREMANALGGVDGNTALIGRTLTLKTERTLEFPEALYEGHAVRETFSFERTFTIEAIVEETPFLNEPRIFFSHASAMSFLASTHLSLLSLSLGREMDWLTCLEEASNDRLLSGFRYLVFVTDHQVMQRLYEYSQQNQQGTAIYEIRSHAYISRQAFDSIAEILKIALVFFVAIAVIGSLFILGISGYSSFISHLKDSAILLALGATLDEIRSIFLNESLAVGAFSACLGIIVSFPFQILVNHMMGTQLGISAPIRIPYASFMGFSFFLPFLVVLVSIGLSLFATGLPISLYQTNTLTTHLRDE